jgi:hypothetical protein
MARVVIAILYVPDEQAVDERDLTGSIGARLRGEAGYLENGDPITPLRVQVILTSEE